MALEEIESGKESGSDGRGPYTQRRYRKRLMQKRKADAHRKAAAAAAIRIDVILQHIEVQHVVQHNTTPRQATPPQRLLLSFQKPSHAGTLCVVQTSLAVSSSHCVVTEEKLCTPCSFNGCIAEAVLSRNISREKTVRVRERNVDAWRTLSPPVHVTVGIKSLCEKHGFVFSLSACTSAPVAVVQVNVKIKHRKETNESVSLVLALACDVVAPSQAQD